MSRITAKQVSPTLPIRAIDPWFELTIDQPELQIAFKIAERLFDPEQLHVVTTQLGGIAASEVGA